jgi:pyridoxine 5-phosphate synthase
VHLLKDTLTIPMNLEMAASPAMVAFALGLRPEHCCLVPERREELTTEGGLNVAGGLGRMTEVVGQLQAAGIVVSLFIDPHPRQIEAAHAVGAPVVELHTGAYADAQSEAARARELLAVVQGVEAADALGLTVHAGHGLHYHNVEIIAALPQLRELNIGHAIIARALFTGLPEAVREMKRLLREARL